MVKVKNTRIKKSATRFKKVLPTHLCAPLWCHEKIITFCCRISRPDGVAWQVFAYNYDYKWAECLRYSFPIKRTRIHIDNV